MPEHWTEVNLVLNVSPDEALLCDRIYPLVKDTLGAKILCWFFFWEPDLRLRLRWSSKKIKSSGDQLITATLDDWRERNIIRDWFEGNHGRKGERYQGEADIYGADMWPICQQDWMNGSEFAVKLFQLQRAGKLSRDRDFHWARHVHLFSNQLVQRWDEEIRLSLKQGIGYLSLLQRGLPANSKTINKMIADINAVLGRVGELVELEEQMMQRWDAAGRPDWNDFLKLERKRKKG